MTKKEFELKAKEMGYSQKDISEMVKMVEDAQKGGASMTLDYVAENVLEEQPKY